MSGLFFDGPPSRILEAWSLGRLELAVSAEILHEYRRVAERLQIAYPGIDIGGALDALTREAILTHPAPLPPDACTDSDDVKFLACAVAAAAHCVVSGDTALLRCSGLHGVEVVTPRTFVDRHLS